MPHPWDEAYRGEQAPPWDIGRPQPAFLALTEEGHLAGQLLDAGCGTGEHTLLAAAHGATATGVDLSAKAIELAREKAQQRGLQARFEVGDLLEMTFPTAFDTILDSGLFHTFDDEGRQQYVATLARLTRPGGMVHLLCFSDRQPGDWGPRRVRREELAAAFAVGWHVEEITAAAFEIIPMPGVPVVDGWLARVRRT